MKKLRKVHNIAIYFVASCVLHGCTSPNQKINTTDYKEAIIGTWKGEGAQSASFKMTDSKMIVLDSLLFFMGKETKYNIVGDTLYFIRENGEEYSKSKIELLTKDSLITSNETGSKIFTRE